MVRVQVVKDAAKMRNWKDLTKSTPLFLVASLHHKRHTNDIMKDDISFVSLGATFKPDDAFSVATTETERNWNAVFAEAITVPHESDLPVAQAVAIDQETAVVTPAVATPAAAEQQASTDRHGCNCMVILVGYSFMIFAVATAFGTELGAAALYVVGAGFYKVSESLKQTVGSCTLPFQTIFLMLCSLMLSMDLLLLTIGIFIVEILGWVACGVCVLFGGIAAGSGWHQHIRKVCHLTRWAFRGFHSTWTPKRLQPFSKNNNNTETAPEQVVQPHMTKADYEVTNEPLAMHNKEDTW